MELHLLLKKKKHIFLTKIQPRLSFPWSFTAHLFVNAVAGVAHLRELVAAEITRSLNGNVPYRDSLG